MTYYGRWEKTSEAALANWNNPYVKFNFAGTSLTAEIEGTADISYTIDGTTKTVKGVTGETELISGLGDTTHTAVITITNADGTNGIKSVATDESGAILKSTDNKKYIQFIGDSITTDTRSYSYKIPQVYGYDYSIISTTGIALQDGAGWYYSSFDGLAYKDCVGMESAYFSTKSPRHAYTADENGGWLYENPAFDVANDHAPDVIVIGIGTNDSTFIRENYEGVSGEDFTEAYVEFVNKLNTLYPEAQIYIIRQFNNITDDGKGTNLSARYDAMREATVNAVNELSSNSKVHYIDTSEWEVAIGADNIHPSESGYAALRDLVYNEIKASLE